MFRRMLLVACSLCLVGQGCLTPAKYTSDQDLRQTGTPSPDGFVAFMNGFGALPGTNPYRPPAGAHPTINVEAEVPNIPSAVTVLREWRSAPDETLLRNITAAVQIPPGALGASPNGDALIIRWRTGGYAWSYDSGDTLPVSFQYEGDAQILAQETEDPAIAAQLFLSNQGITMAGWGAPIQNNQEVTFAASRDEQPVVNAQGTSVPAAVLQLNQKGGVVQGAFEVARRQDRSNYPALSLEEVLTRLQNGGTHPLSGNGEITIEQITPALYRHDGIVSGSMRTFYVPALWAKGSLRRDGETSPYETLVPLIQDDAFGQAQNAENTS